MNNFFKQKLIIQFIFIISLASFNHTSLAAFVKYDNSSQKQIDRYDNEICRSKSDNTYNYGKISNNACLIDLDEGTITAEDFEVYDDNKPRFDSYKPNYVGYIPDRGDTEAHIEMLYSIKYRISDIKINENRPYDNYLFLAYTGKFDFFWGSKDSSPVINRLNNPELHYRRYLSNPYEETNFSHKYIDFAYGHESNGQVISDAVSFSNSGPDAIDHVSRGWDYISAEYKFELYNKPDCEFVELSCFYGHIYVRSFQNDGLLQGKIEDRIFWDPTVDAKIEDFDGLRLIFGKEHPFGDNLFPTKGIWITYTTGISSPGEHNSFTLNYRKQFHIWDFKIPVYIRYFNGYGNEIVTYHTRDRIIMLGLQFR